MKKNEIKTKINKLQKLSKQKVGADKRILKIRINLLKLSIAKADKKTPEEIFLT